MKLVELTNGSTIIDSFAHVIVEAINNLKFKELFRKKEHLSLNFLFFAYVKLRINFYGANGAAAILQSVAE